VAAWRIETGRIKGVDVSRQVVVIISTPSRGAPEGRADGVILLDERASPEQVLALLDAFQGRLGGPLAELGPWGVEQRGFSQVPIEYRLAGGRADISVPNRLRLVVHLDLPDESAPPSVFEPRPPSGADGWRGCASEVSVEVSEYALAWHDSKVPATYREVRVESATGRPPCRREGVRQGLGRFSTNR
jgi:hypothetical protein